MFGIQLASIFQICGEHSIRRPKSYVWCIQGLGPNKHGQNIPEVFVMLTFIRSLYSISNSQDILHYAVLLQHTNDYPPASTFYNQGMRLNDSGPPES